MPIQRCGLKLGNRTANVVVRFDPPLTTGQYVAVSLHVADPETNDLLFLLGQVKAAPPKPDQTVAEVSLPVQDTAKGPLIGVSSAGAAKIALSCNETSGGLAAKILARFELVVKREDPYRSPEQQVTTGTPVSWVITS
jgi:hypothetical protein